MRCGCGRATPQVTRARREGRERPRACHGYTGRHHLQQSSGGSMTYEVTKTEQEWALELEPQEFAVLRRAGTERPWTGELLDEKREGVYRCRACGNELFRSDTKFDSHCGWPSFFSPLAGDRVELLQDSSLGMVRTEVRCARCGSHLGHVFDDAPQTPTGDRFCMNSVSLTFEPDPAKPRSA